MARRRHADGCLKHLHVHLPQGHHRSRLQQRRRRPDQRHRAWEQPYLQGHRQPPVCRRRLILLFSRWHIPRRWRRARWILQHPGHPRRQPDPRILHHAQGQQSPESARVLITGYADRQWRQHPDLKAPGSPRRGLFCLAKFVKNAVT